MPSVTDTTPLLPPPNISNGNGHTAPHKSLGSKFLDVLKSKEGPTYIASFRFFLFGSWMNILLVFIPLSICSHYLNWDAGLSFLFSFIAIMPLAALIGTATDQVSVKLGQTLSGLLNATFGNAVEIIVGVAALLQGELRIVQTSLLGSILSNLLLVLGCSFFAAGFYENESRFQATAAQASSSLMTLACITLVIPAAYHSAQQLSGGVDDVVHILPVPIGKASLTQVIDGSDLDDKSNKGLRTISRGTAILLLLVYVAYLFFQLKTHKKLYLSEAEREAQEAQESQEAQAGTRPQTARRTSIDFRPQPFTTTPVEVPDMNPAAACFGLLGATLVTSFCADYLVASIEETAERYSIPKAFIGLILLPIVANAAEHVTSVWMAMKGKMELTIGICVGSSIQIAAFVIPLLVIVGWFTHHDLTLFFADFETIVLFVSVLLVNFLIQDGKSNYMEGLMLITLYLVVSLAFWVS